MLPDGVDCEVIPFPIDRQLFHVRQCARILAVRRGASARRFWQVECRRLESRLIVQGCDAATIHHEIEAFDAAVQREMQRDFVGPYGRGESEPIGGDAA